MSPVNFSEWWERGYEAAQETANLVSLTILALASVLTSDWLLLSIGLGVELSYLLWASFSAHYRKRLESWAHSGKRGVTWLDRILFIVTVAGFVIIVFFGFGKHLLSHPWPSLTHAGGWEAGALAWTSLFLIYYLIKFPFTRVGIVDKVIIFIALGTLPLIYRAWTSMGRPLEHVIWVLAIGWCFFVIDLLISWKHPDREEKNLSRSSFYWADIPMVVAFTTLLIYLLIHRDIEHPDVFVSGVVACQLLISNAVFIVMEFGLLRPSKEIKEISGHDVLDEPRHEQKRSSEQQVAANSRRRYILTLLFASIFIASTIALFAIYRSFPSGGDSRLPFSSDVAIWIAVFTAIVSAIGTFSTVILAWRSDRRDAREKELKIARLERELAESSEKPALPPFEGNRK